MVLEDASSPNDAFSSSSAPDSDIDRYSGDHNPTVLEPRSPTTLRINRPDGLRPLYIDFSKLAFPSFGFGRSNAVVRKQLGDSVQKASDECYRILGRPFEQPEGEAVAFHISKALWISSYGHPVGITAAFFVAARPNAWKTFRFPGWTPGEKFNPDRFLFMKGGLARVTWHVLRFNCYWALGMLGGEILLGAYAATVANVGRLQDPRLKDINENLKTGRVKHIIENLEKLDAERMAAKGVPVEDRTVGRRGPESFEMARQRTRAQNSGTRSQGPVDDMSPTAGSFTEDFGGDGQDMLSDLQIQQMQQQEQGNPDRADAVSSPASSPARNASRSSGPSQSPQPTSSSGGSAWERLRQQAVQRQTPQSSQQQQSAWLPDNDDDNNFGLWGGSTNPQGLTPGRHLDARQQGLDRQGPMSGGPNRSDAQKEFDAQLERERQGQSLEEKSGRW